MSLGALFLGKGEHGGSEVFFVDQLTVFMWMQSVWPRLLLSRLHARPKVLRCYFADASWIALVLAGLSARLLGIGVERMAFRLRDVRDEDGTLVSLRVSYWDKSSFCEDLASEPVFQDLVDSGLLKDRMEIYLTKAAAGGGPGAHGTIGHALFMIRVCAWVMERDHSDENVPVLFLVRGPWFRSLGVFASSHGILLIPVRFTSGMGAALRRRLPARIDNLLRLARHRRLAAMFRNVIRPPVTGHQNAVSNGTALTQSTLSADKPDSAPMLAVEGFGFPYLNQPELQSNLFFWQQSSLPGRNILVTYEIPDAPLDKEGYSEFQQHDITAIALHPAATTVPSTPIFAPSRLEKHLLKVSFHSTGPQTEVTWLREQISNYRRLKAYWMDLCTQFNVKVFVTQNKYDPTHCAVADALRTSGGIAAIYQRAFESQPAVEAAIGADIVFGFSSKVAQIEQKAGSEITYHVATGFPADHRFPLLREGSNVLRETLQRNGAEHILAFFDENSLGDDRWETGHGYMQDNYHFLLQKVIDEPWFGLVIKPKIPRTVESRLGPIAEVLKRAEATGRCFMFREDALRGTTTPAAAALAADAAVHSHLFATTAAFEAALAGVPSLVIDRDGWVCSPLYQLSDPPVVFKTWEELWDSCQRHWSDQAGTPGFGDWSPILNELDPFQDGRAAERVGTYLHWILEGFSRNEDRGTIMSDTAQRYCDLWGDDKISQVNSIRADVSPTDGFQAVESRLTPLDQQD